MYNREMTAVKSSQPWFLQPRRAAFFAGAFACCLLLSACGKEKTTPVSSASAQTTVPSVTEGTAAQTLAAPQVGWCNADELHVRSGPGDYQAIGGLKYGEKVYILGREGDWYKIEFADGTAYVSAAFIQDTEIPEGATFPGESTTAAEGSSVDATAANSTAATTAPPSAG